MFCYLKIQIRGLRVLCSQEAVTSRGLNQEELSSDSSSAADIADSAGKIIFLNVFQRWRLLWVQKLMYHVLGFQCQSQELVQMLRAHHC